MTSKSNGFSNYHAQKYLARGWFPLPVPAGSKGPSIGGWQNLRLRPDQIPKAFPADSNIGLILGEPSKGLVDIDLDCVEAVVLADAYLPKTGMISGRGGSLRSHWWYLSTQAQTAQFRDTAGAMLIELRSTGGQTLVHPSKHPSGDTYEWDGGSEPGEPAEVSADDLLRRVQRIAAGALLARRWLHEGGRHELALALGGLLARNAIKEDAAAAFVGHVATIAGDDEVDDRRRAVLDSYDALRHDGQPTGGPTVAKLVGQDVLQKLCDWLGFKPGEKSDTVEAPRLKEFRALSSAALAGGDFTPQFLVDRVLVEAQPCILGGRKKTLKTSLLVDLAISLSTGGHFLGKFPVPEAKRVGLMSGESGLGVLQETAHRVAQAAGHHLVDLSNIVWSDELPRAGDAVHMHGLGEFIEGNELDVLLLDPAYLMMPSDNSGNLMAQGELLRGLSDVCAARGVTLVIAHHLKNSGGEHHRPPELGDLAWAGFAEWARQWLLLGRRDDYQDGTGFHEMWLRVGGSAGHSSLWALDVEEGANTAVEGREWSVTLTKGSEAVTARKEKAERKRTEKAQRTADGHVIDVRDALRGFPDGATKRTLTDSSGVNNAGVSRALETLRTRGEIEQSEGVARGQTTVLFKLIKR